MFASGNYLFSRLASLLARQQVRFLIAGAWNTVFGYGVYAGMLCLFQPRVHYMVIAVVGNVLAISMAYATKVDRDRRIVLVADQ